ncbi:MAG: class I SAM-dependent methyltransferase, partial [Planctomycetes bacterium]|nr:class I SAM-dependent methyltransferase [Planctomycetota bacterium]
MAAWNRIAGKFLCRQLRRVRRRRAAIFLRLFQPSPEDTVLDLGSEDGSEVASFYPYPEKVVIADVNEGPLHRGVETYGFAGCVLLHPDKPLPFETASFDVVLCSSVIEHVTGIDSSVVPPRNAAEYRQHAERRQREFAEEIRRVGRGYWVQTPNRRFPIEAHSMLPWIQCLSPYRQYQASRALKHIW